MQNPDIKAVIFDCDGTLVDSEIHSLEVLVDFVAESGLHVSHEEAMERFAGNELSVVFDEFERRLGRPLPHDFLPEFRRRQMAVLNDRVQPIDGADDLLASMKLPYCVASNAPLNKINLCLQATGLRRHFSEEQLFSAYQINVWKPAPDLFLMAADALKVEPQHCAVVEDSRFGVDAGLAAGMQVFALDPHDRINTDRLVTRIKTLGELTVAFAIS